MKTNKLFKTFLTAGLVATTLLTGCLVLCQEKGLLK